MAPAKASDLGLTPSPKTAGRSEMAPATTAALKLKPYIMAHKVGHNVMYREMDNRSFFFRVPNAVGIVEEQRGRG